MQAKLSGALLFVAGGEGRCRVHRDVAASAARPSQRCSSRFQGTRADRRGGWDEYEIPDLTGAATVDDFRDGAAYQRLLDAARR